MERSSTGVLLAPTARSARSKRMRWKYRFSCHPHYAHQPVGRRCRARARKITSFCHVLLVRVVDNLVVEWLNI